MKKLVLVFITFLSLTISTIAVAASAPAQPDNASVAERVKLIDTRIQRHKEMINYLEKVKESCVLQNNAAECKRIKEDMKATHESYRKMVKTSRENMQNSRKQVIKNERKAAPKKKAAKKKKAAAKEQPGAPIEYAPSLMPSPAEPNPLGQ